MTPTLPNHLSSFEIIFLDDSDDEELLDIDLVVVTSLDDIHFSNDGPGNNTCTIRSFSFL